MRPLNKGSALLVTLMVMVLLSLTGISFIFLADTENAISNNYYRGISTLIAGETGVYLVNSWFNNPLRTYNPSLTSSDPTQGLVPLAGIITWNSRTLAKDAAGNATYWKKTGSGGYTLFDKPFMGAVNTSSVIQQFYGTASAPDIQIMLNTTGLTNISEAYLKQLNNILFGVTYPVTDTNPIEPVNGGVQITEIDLYSAPCAPFPATPTNPNNSAYGICTALVTVQMCGPPSGNKAGKILSTRYIRGIISDINYSVSGEALDVDGDVGTKGAGRYHWGLMKTTSTLSDNNSNHINAGGAYYADKTGHVGYWHSMMMTYDHSTGTASFPNSSVMNGANLSDPWVLYRALGSVSLLGGATCTTPGSGVVPAGGTSIIPYPMTPTGDPSNYTCDLAYNSTSNAVVLKSIWGNCRECTANVSDPVCGVNAANCTPKAPDSSRWAAGNYYNIWGCDPSVAFATSFRGYSYWKRVIIAATQQGGGSTNANVHYLVPGGYSSSNSASKCSSGQWGPPGDSTNCNDFCGWTDGKVGFWFFDTTDGQIPKMNGNNLASGDQCTGQYSSEGFIYYCAQSITFHGNGKGSFKVNYPGEPLWENRDPQFKYLMDGYFDDYTTINGTKVYVDRFLNLQYPPTVSSGQPPESGYIVNPTYASSALGLSAGWDQYGPLNIVSGIFHGIFYTTGYFWVTGNEAFYGSLMVWNNSFQSNGTPDIWFDPKLSYGQMVTGLPNSYIEQILTDL